MGGIEGGEDGVIDGKKEAELDFNMVGEWPECEGRIGVDQDGGKRNPKGERGACESEERVRGMKVNGKVVTLKRRV